MFNAQRTFQLTRVTQLYTKSPPFAHLSEMQVIVQIMRGELPKVPSQHPGIPQYMINLLDRCLQRAPESRPAASSILRVVSHVGPVNPRSWEHKPLPAEPEDVTSVPLDPVQGEIATSSTSRSRSASPTSQYLSVPPMSPLSFHSFVMVPSTPSSSESTDSHVILSSSPSSHSHNSSQLVIVTSPSASEFLESNGSSGRAS